MVRSLVSAAVLSLSLAVGGAASAAEWVPKAQGGRVVGEIDWWPTDARDVVSMGVAAQIPLGRVVYLDLDVPWAIHSPDRGDSRFVFGNPTVGVHWADFVNEKLAAYAGGTLTIATMLSDNGAIFSSDFNERRFTRNVATFARAFADFHRFTPEYVFLRGQGGIELQIAPVLYYRVEGVPIIAIPASEIAQDAAFLLEIHNTFEARGRSGVGGGLHLQAVLNTNEFGLDSAMQLAAEPYFVYDPGRGFYARVGTLISVNAPLGFGLDSGMASLRVTLGGRW
jgi:hypothetical protein